VEAVAAGDLQLVIEEIEKDFEVSIGQWHGAGRQAAGCDIERHVPPVINERRKGKANFADDLRPHVERYVGFPPVIQGQRGPSVGNGGFGSGCA